MNFQCYNISCDIEHFTSVISAEHRENHTQFYGQVYVVISQQQGYWQWKATTILQM